jgi:hypothetical protein
MLMVGDMRTSWKGTTEPMLEKPFNVDVVRNLVNVLLRG